LHPEVLRLDELGPRDERDGGVFDDLHGPSKSVCKSYPAIASDPSRGLGVASALLDVPKCRAISSGSGIAPAPP
jgi:hypothetical protein